ncbi:three component ABC system middle component [Corallococcus sp. AB045]|uniref:three component ABC system middle component n=1 Tax=Corallococcus sp. AB045 TaxID=2316719 RepID=UPI003517FC77
MNHVRPWTQRPPEVAALLNPAYCALLLRAAVDGYVKEAEAPFPFPLLPFPLPLSLHAPTRSSLPKTVRTKMHVWVQEHPEAKILFATRARTLTPYFREGLIFAMAQEILAVDANGGIAQGAKKLRRPPVLKGGDAEAGLEAALFVGRWLARAGDLRSVFIAWGVRP